MTDNLNRSPVIESLVQATKVIAQERDRGGLARALLHAALEHTAACRGVVALSDRSETRCTQEAEATFDVFAAGPQEAAVHLPSDLLQWALREREVFVEADDRRSSAFGIGDRNSDPDVTVLCVPLVCENATVGLLYLESSAAISCFTPDRVAAAALLTAQAALALETVRLSGAFEIASRGRRAAEETLRETHSALLKHQEIGRMGDFRYNTRTQESFGSIECYKLFGYDPDLPSVDFSTWTTKIIDEDRDRIIEELVECISNLKPLKFDYRITLGSQIRHIECVGQVDVDHQGDLVYYGVLTDVTERKAAEQNFRQIQLQLDQAHRLASLGELAGSIIHEINQPLSAINTSAEACSRWLDRGPSTLPEARGSLQRVIEEGRRAALVVEGLKNLARSSELHLEDIDVNGLLSEVLALLKPDFDRGRIAISTNLDPSIPRVTGDRVKLQQVVLNLVRNAMDALEGIRTRAGAVSVASALSETGEVCVSVSDNGAGVEAGKSERLFDALYTTKGQGMGLGLSICRKIISAHGGRVWVDDKSTNGATFAFSLPVSPAGERNAVG